MEPAVKIPKQKIPPHPQGNQSPCWPLRDRLIHPLLQVYLQACSECTLRALGSPWKPALFPRAAGSVSDTRSLNGVVVCFLLQIPQLLRPTEVRGQKWRLNGRPSSFQHCSRSGPKNRAAGSLQELEPTPGASTPSLHASLCGEWVRLQWGRDCPPNLSSQFILSVTSYFYVEQSIENMGPHGKLGSRTLTIQMLFTCLQMNGGCRAPAGRNPSSLVPEISLQ